MARKISPEEFLDNPLPDAEELLRLQREAAETFTGSMQEWSERVTEINQEMMSFMQRRTDSNQAMLESLLECRDAEGFSRLHSDWMQSAISDYSEEMQRIMALYTQSLMLPIQAVSKAVDSAEPKAAKKPAAKKRPAA